MQRQLRLIDPPAPRRVPARPADDWRLDERTKEVGRRGLASARNALAEARRRAAA